MLAVALTAGSAGAAQAQVVVEANGARAEERWGGELGLGYRIRIGDFSITPAVGALLLRSNDDRFERDTFSNGQSRCRDTTNGQFAEDANCVGIDARAYGRVEATYRVGGNGVELGGGVRISKDVVPYGTIALPLGGGSAQIKGNAGPDYFAAGLRFSF